MNSLKKGYIFGIIGAALYGSNPLFALPLYEMGMQAGQVLFYRYLIAIVMMAIVLKVKKESFKINRSECRVLLVMGLFFSISSFSLFKSYDFMAAGLATALQFIYPALVVLLMSVFLKEHLSFKTIGIIMMTLMGVLMLYHGNSEEPLSTKGLFFVLLSALLYAVYLVGVNFSVLKEMSCYKLSFYTLVFGLIVYIVNLQTTSSFAIPPTASWKYLIALAALPSNVSLLFTALALRLIGSTKTSILGVFEPLTAIFIGCLVFHEAMTVRIVIGVITIIVAVSTLILSQSTEKSPKRSSHVNPILKFAMRLRQK
ncbi:MAG: DMT family transporter [Bacteroidaceae bacterium]